MTPASTELVPTAEYRALADPAKSMEIVRQTLEGEEVSEFDLTRVRVPSGGGTTWEIPSALGEGTALKAIEGILLFTTTSRAYWKNAYGGGSEPPNCSSDNGVFAREDETINALIGLTIPAEKDPTTGALLCEGCALNQWGSGTNEKGDATRGKACREMRQLFILPPGKLLPMVVVLPPTSLKPLTRYRLGIGDEELNENHVTTKIALDRVEGKGAVYSVATFALGERLTEEQAATVDAYRRAAEPALNRYARAHANDDTPAAGTDSTASTVDKSAGKPAAE